MPPAAAPIIAGIATSIGVATGVITSSFLVGLGVLGSGLFVAGVDCALGRVEVRLSEASVGQDVETEDLVGIAMEEVARRFLWGFGALASFADPPEPIDYPHSNETEALRSDWLRIGEDLRTVVEREDI